MTIEIGKKYKVSGAVLKKLLREANIETLRQIELADISLVDSDYISNVRIRKCTNCIFSMPNAYSKYGHDRYFCNEGVQKNVQTITSPENHNCNRHRFNDES